MMQNGTCSFQESYPYNSMHTYIYIYTVHIHIHAHNSPQPQSGLNRQIPTKLDHQTASSMQAIYIYIDMLSQAGHRALFVG